MVKNSQFAKQSMKFRNNDVKFSLHSIMQKTENRESSRERKIEVNPAHRLVELGVACGG